MPVTTQNTGEPPPGQHIIYEGGERRTGNDRRGVSTRDERVTAATVTGGSSLEMIGGGAAVVLAIIGLSGYLPIYMTAIATIAIGAALVAHGASVSARWADAMRRVAAQRKERTEIATGLGSEVFGGACGIALGILALANIMPFVLLAVAAIVLGGAILLAAPAEPDIAKLAGYSELKGEQVTYRAVEGSSGAMLVAGIGSIVLGILALIRVGPPLTLVLISMLAVGGAVFLSGGALTARFARRLQHVN
jgi:hypothetical protein